MTLEEAIIKLENKRDELCNDCIHIVGWCDNHCGFSEAIDIVIEALRQPTSFNMIDKQVVIDAVHANYDEILDFKSTGRTIADSIEDTISNLPPTQPERAEGEWIFYDKRFPWRTWYKCSNCGNYLDFSGVNGGRGEVNFCPNCGANMKGIDYGN